MSRIGIITNDRHQVFQRDIIAGVESIAGDTHDVLVDSIAEDAHNRRPMNLDIDSLDGVLVIANVLSADELRSLHQRGKPITLVSHFIDDLPIAAVVQNNYEGMLTLVNFVVDVCDRRQIVFIRGDMDQHDGIERDDVYQMGLMQHDLIMPEAYSIRGDFDPTVARESMRAFINSGLPLDAVIASDFLMGCAALDELRAHEYAIPEDVVVVAFGDGPEAIEKGLSVVGVDVVELGRRAARQLFSQIDGMQITGVTSLTTQMIVRASSRVAEAVGG